MAAEVAIYALEDPSTNEIRYVGKANDLSSRLRCHRFEARNSKFQTHKARWLRTLSGEPLVEVLEMTSNETWAERERYWIEKLRLEGHRLTNFADGGQTSPVEGKGHTETSKAKMRATMLAKGVLPPSRKGLAAWNKGLKGVMRINATSFKKGHLAWNKEKTMSAEYVEKNRLGHLGKPWSAARRAAQGGIS